MGIGENLGDRAGLRSLVENLYDIVFRYRFSPPGFDYVNPSSQHLLGYSPAEFYTEPGLVNRILHTDDRAALGVMFQHPEQLETLPPFRCFRQDGGLVWLELHATLVCDEAGRPVALEGVARDITSRQQAADRLRESEEKYRTLFDSIVEGILIGQVILDQDSRPSDVLFLQANAASIRMFPNEVHVGRRLREIDPAVDPAWLETWGRVACTGKSEHLERYVPCLQRWFDIRLFPVGAAASRQVAALFEDITEGKRAGEERHRSDLQLQELIKYASTGIYEIEFEGPRFKSINDAMCQILGYSRDELLATNPFDLLDAESQARFRERIRLTLAGQTPPEPVEYRVLPRDGRVIYALLNVTFTYRAGKPVGAFVIAHDITERREMEEALRESEQRYWAIFDKSPFAIALTRMPEGITVGVNDAFLKLFESSREDVLGKSSVDLGIADAESRARVAAELNNHGSVRDLVAMRSTSSGALRALSLNLDWVSIRGERHVLTTIRDITERVQAEAERQALLEREQAALVQAEAAVRLRDQFISVASHELKTPLTTIKGYADLLVQRGEQVHLDESFRRMAHTIYAQSGRLEKMIGALLDVSRIEGGQLSIERQPIALHRLIEGVVTEVSATAPRHRLAFADDGRGLVVEGDEPRLEQVFQNLIQNAVKYSPHGGPVSVRLWREGPVALVSIADKGIGIPSEDLPQLFTRFQRARNAETFHINGLGVGLYVVREIVRLHGGDITVESQEGVSSTFTVRLPLAAERD